MRPSHSTKLTPFEYRLYRELQALGNLRGEKLLVACSGGRDSQALLRAMVQVSGRLGCSVIAAHVNHGPNKSRDRAEFEVREAAKKLGLRISTARYRGQTDLKSEADLRNFRHSMLEKIRNETGAKLIALAHHADDLFETRMIRLVRGTGPQGLRAMRFLDGVLLRPWLGESREAIAEYVMQSGILWVEDPTNAESDPLRNWMRNKWFVDLEAKRPGAIQAMARSLESLVQSLRDSGVEILEIDGKFAVSREAFIALDVIGKREVIAKLLKTANVQSFGKSHLDEVCKRLATQQKRFTFTLLKHRFEINAEHVMLSVESATS